MSGINNNLRLTPQEIAEAFADANWSKRFPPVLTVAQAAELAVVPIGTIYTWSSQGLLNPCARRVGKYLRIFRNRFIELIFNKGLNA